MTLSTGVGQAGNWTRDLKVKGSTLVLVALNNFFQHFWSNVAGFISFRSYWWISSSHQGYSNQGWQKRRINWEFRQQITETKIKNKGLCTGTISSVVISTSTSMEFLIFCYDSRAAAVPVIRWITKITWSAVEQSRAAKQSSGHKRGRPGAVERRWYTIFECQVLLQNMFVYN